MRRLLILLAVALMLGGCVTYSPPSQIQGAIATIDKYMPEYVSHANVALGRCGGPEKAKYIGIGERLENAVHALRGWSDDKSE